MDGDYEFRMIAPWVYGQSYSRPFCPINIIDPDRYSISIKQVTIEDAMDADMAFSMLMGDEVEPRRNFIIENAHYANLDI